MGMELSETGYCLSSVNMEIHCVVLINLYI